MLPPPALSTRNSSFACVSAESAFYFVRFGGIAAKTNEINVSLHPAGGEKIKR
jgi:hypothetical protein